MTIFTRRRFLGTASAAVALAPYMPAFAQIRRVTIGTNPAGSIYFTLGGGLAKVLTEKMGVQAIVQPFAGSSVYLPLVDNGEVTAGLSSTLDSGAAYRGDLEYKGRATKKLRSLWRWHHGRRPSRRSDASRSAPIQREASISRSVAALPRS